MVNLYPSEKTTFQKNKNCEENFVTDLNESVRPGGEEERDLGRAPATVGQARL